MTLAWAWAAALGAVAARGAMASGTGAAGGDAAAFGILAGAALPGEAGLAFGILAGATLHGALLLPPLVLALPPPLPLGRPLPLPENISSSPGVLLSVGSPCADAAFTSSSLAVLARFLV